MASRRRPRDAVDESEGCQGRSIIHVILDDDREDVVAPDQTAVEEGEAGRHEVDLRSAGQRLSSYEDAGSTHQRAGHEDPGRVARVDAAGRDGVGDGVRAQRLGHGRGRRWF